ncbi:unnamed protein product, partial [Sphacelaria rigidula]
NINLFHQSYDHLNEVLPRETADAIDVELEGELESCHGCSLPKGL